MNLNMHMISTLELCPNLHRQKHHSYVWQIHRPNPHPIILLLMGDGTAAFRLASNLKTAWLGSTCQGYNPVQSSGSQRKIILPTTTRLRQQGGFFWLLQSYFTNSGSLMCCPPGLKYLLATKSRFGVCQNYFKELECLENVSIWFFIGLLCESESFSW